MLRGEGDGTDFLDPSSDLALLFLEQDALLARGNAGNDIIHDARRGLTACLLSFRQTGKDWQDERRRRRR